MIIQIQCNATKKWSDRCSCKTQAETDKEISALEKIYRFNKFRITEGEKENIPGPTYSKKSESQVKEIVAGVDWLMTQPKDKDYANKMLKVLQSNKKN